MMSNKKRILKKRKQLKSGGTSDLRNLKVTPDVIEAMKKIANAARNAALTFKEITPKQLEGMWATLENQPRKPYPEDFWNPPIKNNEFLVVGERIKESISYRFGKMPLRAAGENYKDIFLDDANAVSSWDEYFNRRRSEDKRPFLKFLEDEIINKCQIPGETHSGEAEKF